jgi:hypothetical protein
VAQLVRGLADPHPLIAAMKLQHSQYRLTDPHGVKIAYITRLDVLARINK